MKKQIILLVTVLVAIISQAISQQQSYGGSSSKNSSNSSSSSDLSFTKSTKILNIGIGLAGNYFPKTSGFTANPPISPFLSFEKGITDNISVGVGAAYGGTKYDEGGGFGFTETVIAVGARGSYHFLTTDKIDPYAGAALNYMLVSLSTEQSSVSDLGVKASGIGIGAFGGIRYYFTPKFGVHGELGFGGLALLNAGISFKF